jgi:hypothetical protein
VQGVLQQTPSVQLPLAHSKAMAQAWPGMRWVRQALPSQKKPAWQSVCFAQLDAHEPFMQTFGEQLTVAPGTHAPLPLQVLAALCLSPVQLPGAHSFPCL